MPQLPSSTHSPSIDGIRLIDEHTEQLVGRASDLSCDPRVSSTEQSRDYPAIHDITADSKSF
jgi:hypothetical protein